MATLEREAPRLPSAAPADPVFSADDGRRERVLKIVGRVAAVVAGIWLLALLAGAMGFGHLPGLPGAGLLDRPAKTPAKTPPAPAAGASGQTSFAGTVSPAAGQAQQRARSQSARARAQAHKTAATQPPAGVVPPPAARPASPGNPQGRAVRRHGNKAQPAPPPPGNGKGNGNGQAVVNPGRTKHLVPPPPPPPPPPPKKP